MTETTAFQGIDTLQKERGRKFGSQAIAIIQKELMTYSDEAMDSAVTYFLLNSNSLPTAGQLLEKVKACHQKILDQAAIARESQSVADKKDYPTLSDVAQSTKCGRDCLSAMSHLYDGKIDLKKYLLRCVHISDEHGLDPSWIEPFWNELRDNGVIT